MRKSLYSGAGAVAAGWPRPSRGWQIPQERTAQHAGKNLARVSIRVHGVVRVH
jgi:hypothetical protein